MDNDDASECRDEMRRAADEWAVACLADERGRSDALMRVLAERSYVYALESLLATIAGATTPTTAPAVAAFVAAQAATKALIPATKTSVA